MSPRVTDIVLMVVIATVMLAFCAPLVLAQEHDHGVNVPDWYDPLCCNQRDCRPVDDSEVEFDMIGGAPVARHIPTGSIFTQDRWKTSQDERYHVCIWNGNPLCFYVRGGV